MMDAVRSRNHPEEKIVVLREIILRPEAAQLADQRQPDSGEMTKVVVGEEKIRRPVRLKHRGVETGFCQLVLVRIDQVGGVGMLLQ